MTNKEYMQKMERLKEIEVLVKKPEFSLDQIDTLLEETKKIVEECQAYTRGLKEKIDTLG